jgi:hypothetical protein
MESQPTEDRDITEEEGDGTPVCIRCFRPVHPLHHSCPHCGEAVGQFTQYIPFVNLRWQVSVWGRMWQQVWSHNVSFMGRLLRLLMIIWNVPILLLIGLPFKIIQKSKKKRRRQDTESNLGQNPGSSSNS